MKIFFLVELFIFITCFTKDLTELIPVNIAGLCRQRKGNCQGPGRPQSKLLL